MPRLPISTDALRRVFRRRMDLKALDNIRRDPHLARDLGLPPLPPDPLHKPELW